MVSFIEFPKANEKCTSISNSSFVTSVSQNKGQKCFYAPGLKGLPGHLVIGLSVCLSVRLSVRNSVPLTNNVQYLKFGW